MNSRPPLELRSLVRAMRDRPVVIVGDLMLDAYLWGAVSRISPEAPVPVVDVASETFRPGGAANVAANLTALGARPLLFGLVGEDEGGGNLLAMLRERGIDTGGVSVVASRPTTVKTRVMAQGSQVVRVDREVRGPLESAVARRLADAASAALAASGAALISDYGKGVVTRSLLAALKAARPENGWIGVDPKDPTMELYRGASFITPNLAEAGLAWGRPLADERLVVEAGRELLSRLELRALLITRGDEGMTLFETGGAFTHFPTVALEVYDVTGAGDTVIAAFMAALAAGGSLAEAAVVANHAAGIAVREVGTAAVSAEELLAALDE